MIMNWSCQKIDDDNNDKVKDIVFYKSTQNNYEIKNLIFPHTK